MRLDRIDLSWFRGAADPVALETRGRSIVVYGENGSGKSSFVDAVEYILCDGRVDHLAHEYSGKRQEKAIPNTHTPKDRACELQITLQDRSAVKVRIQHDGKAERTGSGATSVEDWDYRRTVLRQHEVSAFIHGSKTEKFSALLPLLGLRSLELIADNLRDLAKAIDDAAQLSFTTYKLAQLATQRKATFGSATDGEIAEQVRKLHTTYCPDRAATVDPTGRCKDLATALQARLDSSSADQRLHVALQDLGTVAFTESIDIVRAANASLAAETEPLIRERVDVLTSARTYAERLGSEDEVSCPACGRIIEVGGLRAHVETEHARLQGIIKTTALRSSAIDTLVQSIATLRATLGKDDLKTWKDSLTGGPHGQRIQAATSFDGAGLRANCTEDGLKSIERELVPIVAAAKSASTNAPPEVKQLADDKRVAEGATSVFAATATESANRRAQSLVNFISALERGAREEILARTKTVIDTISTDVRTMWAILHPDEPIEGVRLYVPRDGDRAIEIGLKFHGVDQESPRLTLSEGYRNSLGLCIFLAMAKREAPADRPVLLDDVVVSLDRNHRGMVVDLLDKEFGGRQVLLFTHDRDWYIELRHRLDAKRWTFKMLRPYETPAVGIRWSKHATSFDEARAHLPAHPDSAANEVRKIMDAGMANIAESLELRLPYLRAERNDKRSCSEFLERLIADGKTRLKRKRAGELAPDAQAIADLEEASRLLVTWGNKGSHTKDVVEAEATKLIDTCESALARFKCPSCDTYLWSLVSGRAGWKQCECGELRWG